MDRNEANESVAEKFTRVMSATPSPVGAFSDVGLASAVAGAIVVFGFFAVRRAAGAPYVVMALAAAPLLAALLMSLAMRGSRELVVDWLAAQPFPIDNLNALLAGVGDNLEVVFAPSASIPTRADFQPKLDEISDDVLLVKERAEEHYIQIRIGVIDSKRMPLRSNHQRWQRFVAIVERVLVPLSKTSPIERVRVV